MTSTVLFLTAALILYPADSLSQEINAWGETFDCFVDWFRPCTPIKAPKELAVFERDEKLPGKERADAASLLAGLNAANLPPPVKNVLEDPSLETAREYVAWRREANEALAQASEYIAQAEHELGPVQGLVGEKVKKRKEIEKRGLVGLYYFFSPHDPSAREDVKVLNKVWQEEQLGVVGIPVRAGDEEVMRFVRRSQPLFPVRKGGEEVKLMRPQRTPNLYLALPLQKKIFRVGSAITEAAIKDALAKAVTDVFKERFGSDPGP